MTYAESAGTRRGLALAVAAVICFSTSPVLILLAAPLSAFEITFGRLGTAGVAIMALARLTGQPLWPRREDLGRFAVFGLITALHFVGYIGALKFTTIAHALAIEYTAPIFVTLFSAWMLHEPVANRKWAGVLVTVLGIAVLAGLEPRLDERMLLGDLMALGSAVAYGLYSVAGRSQRERYPLFTYAGSLYVISALWALPFALFSFTPGGYQAAPLLALLGAGLLPLGTGHTLYNAALRRLHATTVNLIATQEVTGGVLLGALLLSQIPAANEIAGAGIALLGVALVLL